MLGGRYGNGILNLAPKTRGGVLALGDSTGDNALLGYLAGALQGGNLGQSIGRGLEGFIAGTRLDEQRLAPAQTYPALAAAGVPGPVARAAALNRDVMKAVVPAYIGPGQLNTAAVAALNTAVGQLGDLMGPETSNATVVPPDMAQALRASGVPDDDIRGWTEMLEAARAPEPRKTAVGRGLDLVQSRLADLQARYRSRDGKSLPQLLSPKSKATLDKLREWTGGGSSSNAIEAREQ